MLTIVLLTCKRAQPEYEISYAARTLRTVLNNIRSSEPLAVHIADDSVKDETNRHVEELIAIANGEGFHEVTSTRTFNSGYGANYNLAMQHVHQTSDFVLPLEDDWELIKELNVDPIIDVISNGPDIGCVRLGYLGYTQRLEGTFFAQAGLHWIKLNPFSAEPHVFAGHPRIESVSWARTVGPWQVGLTPGETEWEVSHRREARQGVVWPISLTRPEGEVFAHIGTIQSTEGRD